MKIAILTFNTAINYGARLQAHALQHVLDELGIDSFHIKEKGVWGGNWILLLKRLWKIPRNFRYFLFSKKYLRFWKGVYSVENIDLLNDSFDGFISGSDQIWGLRGKISSVYFQRFVLDKKKKIAYAASMGNPIVSLQAEKELSQVLGRFDAISVRESSAQKVLQSYTDIPIEIVLDPVFLPGRTYWDSLSGKRIERKPYIFVYGTEMSDTLKNAVLDLQAKTGLAIRTVFRFAGNRALDWKTGPLEFINYVRYADYIITSSFHCTAFALIYRKKLIYIPHSSTSSRGVDLLKEFGMEECIYSEQQDYSEKTWNYRGVEKLEMEAVEKSKEFLKRALNVANG